ncbi:hypothetical protein L7F22_012007 [Adiantum nelumboides]|nr:hypothetical protein [Adiantum nelumboides]
MVRIAHAVARLAARHLCLFLVQQNLAWDVVTWMLDERDTKIRSRGEPRELVCTGKRRKVLTVLLNWAEVMGNRLSNNGRGYKGGKKPAPVRGGGAAGCKCRRDKG